MMTTDAKQAEWSNRFRVVSRRLEFLRREQLRLLDHAASLRETVETLRTERDRLEAAMLVGAWRTGDEDESARPYVAETDSR